MLIGEPTKKQTQASTPSAIMTAFTVLVAEDASPSLNNFKGGNG